MKNLSEEARNSRINTVIGEHCEMHFCSYYREHNIRLKKISPIIDGLPKFDESGIREFIKDSQKRDYVIFLLKQLKVKQKNESGYDLPDYIYYGKDEDIQFYEIKKLGSPKFKLSDITQKNTIRFLSSKNFLCHIVRINIPARWDLSEEEIEYIHHHPESQDGTRFQIVDVKTRILGELIHLEEFSLELIRPQELKKDTFYKFNE